MTEVICEILVILKETFTQLICFKETTPYYKKAFG